MLTPSYFYWDNLKGVRLKADKVKQLSFASVPFQLFVIENDTADKYPVICLKTFRVKFPNTVSGDFNTAEYITPQGTIETMLINGSNPEVKSEIPFGTLIHKTAEIYT